MSVIDLLRKLGILRFGTYKGTYTSAKDMPSEMFMDDVYNADKDLVSKDKSKTPPARKNDEKQFCTHCGAEMTAGSNFCAKCGEAVSKTSEPGHDTSPTVQAAPAAPRKKMARWKKILIGIGLFIFFIIVLANWATGDLLIPINNQLDALRGNDIESAYNETSTAFKKATSLYTFKRFVNSYPGLSNNKEASFSERKFENDLGYVKGSLTDQNGGVIPIEYQLVKENDSWKILAINIPKAGK